jgi:sodium/hydrogen exchanger-like protein 6/7
MTLSASVVAIIFYTIISSFMQHKKIKWLHESGIAIIVGFIYSKLVLVVNPNYKKQGFNNIILFLVILPPIIFHEGYSVKKGIFFHNLFKIICIGIIIIVIKGILGTFINFLLIYGLTSLINDYDLITIQKGNSLDP